MLVQVEEDPLDPPIDMLPGEHNAGLRNFYNTVIGISKKHNDAQSLDGKNRAQRCASLARDQH